MSYQGSTSARSTTSTITTPSKSDSVSVEIRGRRLSLKTDKGQEHVRKLAAFVDAKASQIQSAAPGVQMEKLLMLVSMMVADELFEANSQLDTLKTTTNERITAALAVIDELESMEEFE